MKDEVAYGINIRVNGAGDRLFGETFSRVSDEGSGLLLPHGLPQILSGKVTDEVLGQFARRVLALCAPGKFSKADLDRAYESDLQATLKLLGVRNRTEMYKRFKGCVCYAEEDGFSLWSQKREGRFAYFNIGQAHKLPKTVSDAELGRAIRETLAASN